MTAKSDLDVVVEEQRKRKLMAGVPVTDTVPDEDRDKVFSPSTKMAVALARLVNRTGTPTYAGTVFGAAKRARRKVGRAQRKARKLHRGNR